MYIYHGFRGEVATTKILLKISMSLGKLKKKRHTFFLIKELKKIV